MPVIGTPTRTRLVTREDVRLWLRDFPPGYVPGTGVLNTLLDGVEFSDADVDARLRMSVDRYNTITPVTQLSEDLVPRVLLLYGAAAHLLASESWRQLRNQATAQAEGVVPTGVDDKHALYRGAADALLQQFDLLARPIKTQRNMESMYGGFGSGYAWVSSTRYG